MSSAIARRAVSNVAWSNFAESGVNDLANSVICLIVSIFDPFVVSSVFFVFFLYVPPRDLYSRVIHALATADGYTSNFFFASALTRL